jgi:hypothetical protein
VSGDRWASLRFEIEHGAGQGVADDVTALLAERDQLAGAWMWVASNIGVGECLDRWGELPWQVLDALESDWGTPIAGDSGDK